ncbi:MAG: UbiX family flavin prenyltransferase [Gammaproteobacteria bacterium]|nr:UbiX family flavin prenyltransferase [Gammaproteobacteria bacterium]MCZ6715874.1 UbiX family flavin prenyltransferase [Gammaproteobacteria bacterium]MCZ6826945.1 UbiX family flavin prenyltransferase [Gammaproteobacteria bacterium]MCZ6879722.1 UbiX family flavin prenyltransferase [Gammaproteobacteria bacterium]
MERQDAQGTISLAWSGASGAQYGIRLLECLLGAGQRVFLMLSKPAQIVIAEETDLSLPGRSKEIARVLQGEFSVTEEQLQVFGREEWTAPVASGSARIDAMVICPCSMATVSAVAAGTSKTLIERAADVMLKEGRKLILVPRETPFSIIHLENMLRLARAGAIILPASPGFYGRPKSVAELVDFVVARILDQLDIPHKLLKPWGS